MKPVNQFLDQILAGQVPSLAFEDEIRHVWENGHFLQRGRLNTADQLVALAHKAETSRYGSELENVHFDSQQLCGGENVPCGIHIVAPGEGNDSPLIKDRNRPPHTHDSGRLSIITQGQAILYINCSLGNQALVVEVDVQENDFIYWPGGIAHTFNAGENGFSLLSIMGRDEDRYSELYPTPGINSRLDFDAMQRISYEEYLERQSRSA